MISNDLHQRLQQHNMLVARGTLCCLHFVLLGLLRLEKESLPLTFCLACCVFSYHPKLYRSNMCKTTKRKGRRRIKQAECKHGETCSYTHSYPPRKRPQVDRDYRGAYAVWALVRLSMIDTVYFTNPFK